MWCQMATYFWFNIGLGNGSTKLLHKAMLTYRKISDIRRTKSPNLNDSHLALQFSLPNPGIEARC